MRLNTPYFSWKISAESFQVQDIQTHFLRDCKAVLGTRGRSTVTPSRNHKSQEMNSAETAHRARGRDIIWFGVCVLPFDHANTTARIDGSIDPEKPKPGRLR